MSEFRQADLLTYGLRSGDAVGDHSIAVARVLRRLAGEVRIWVSHPPGPVPDDIAPLVRQIHYADYPGGADLTFLQYPLWFPLAEHFRRAGGVRLMWYHGVTPPRLWAAGERDLLRNGEVRSELAWYAHAVAAASPFIAGELHGHSGYPRERIQIVPLGVDLARFAQPPDRHALADLRRQWRIQDKRVLLYVGRVAGNKRIDLILQALARLLPVHPDLHLLVLGDTQDGTVTQALTASLQALAYSLNIAHAVTFTGRVPAVAPFLHLADIFVQPSEHEGFGVPLVEAMAAGAPIVAGASGALPWLLGADAPDAAPSGLLFTPGDAGALAEQLRTLLEDPARAAELVRRGRARAAAFGLDAFTRGIEGLVQQAQTAAASPLAAPHGFVDAPLYTAADIALRDYRVRSTQPVVGPLVEWARINSMSHLKEAYLDRVVEQQVNFNRVAARHLLELRAEVDDLLAEVAAQAAARGLRS
jgi:glycosyltransferase involved in cell wall biosynthesis